MTRDQFLKKFERRPLFHGKFVLRNEKVSEKPSVFHSNLNTPKVKDISRFSEDKEEPLMQAPPRAKDASLMAARKV